MSKVVDILPAFDKVLNVALASAAGASSIDF